MILAWFSLIGDVLRSIVCEQRRRKCTKHFTHQDHRQWASPMFTINENEAVVPIVFSKPKSKYEISARAVQTPVILAPAPAVKTPGPAPARNF
jgi:hypothetical protein